MKIAMKTPGGPKWWVGQVELFYEPICMQSNALNTPPGLFLDDFPLPNLILWQSCHRIRHEQEHARME